MAVANLTCVATSPAGFHSGLADNNDGTVVTLTPGLSAPGGNVPPGSWWIGYFNDLAIPLASIRAVTVRMRARNAASGSPAIMEGWTAYQGGAGLARQIQATLWDGAGYSFAYRDFSSSPTKDPLGNKWTKEGVNAIELWFRHGGFYTGNVNLAELDLDVHYNEPNKVTFTFPAHGSTVTDTSRPRANWWFYDSDADTLERYRLKVFSQAQYQAADFNPETSVALWDSGEVFSNVPSTYPKVSLANGTYRYYIKTVESGAGGEYGWGNLLRYNEASMETDASGWTALSGSQTLSTSTTFAREGVRSLSITATAAGTLTTRLLRTIAVTPTAYYGAEATVASNASRNMRVGIQFYNSTGGTLATHWSTAQGTAPGGVRLVLPEVAAPALAVNASVVIEVASAANGEVFYVDAVMFWGNGVESRGNWAHTEFTVNVTPPNAPTLTAVADSVLRRTVLTLTPATNMPQDEFTIEWSEDNGQTWYPLSGANPYVWENLLTENEESVETDATGWFSDSGNDTGYPLRTNVPTPRDGAWNLAQKRTPASGGAGTVVAAQLIRHIPVASGERFFGWMATRPDVTARNVSIDAAYFDAAKVATTTVNGTVVAQTAGQWRWAHFDSTASGTAASLRPRLRVIDPAAGESHFFDMMRVSKAPLTFYDYTNRSGVARIYRARGSLRTVDADGLVQTLVSPWSASTAGATVNLTNWHIMDPSDPANSAMDLFLDGETFDVVRPEAGGAFTALGRKTKIIVTDTPLKGDEFGMNLLFFTQEEYDKWESLDSRQRTMLIRNPRGQAWWAKVFGDRGISRSGVGNQNIRTVTVRVIEQRNVDQPVAAPQNYFGPVDGEWIPLTLINGWVQVGTVVPAYMKDSRGIVHTRGTITGGGGGTTFATLPVGFRPRGQMYISWIAVSPFFVSPAGTMLAGYDSTGAAAAGQSAILDDGHWRASG